MTGSSVSNCLGMVAAVKLGEEKDELLSQLMTTVFVEQPLATPGSGKNHKLKN